MAFTKKFKDRKEDKKDYSGKMNSPREKLKGRYWITISP